MNRNLWLLAICQGLFLTNNVTFIAINGLVGLSLAPLGWMATLPVMGYVVGGALSHRAGGAHATPVWPQGVVPARAAGGAAVGRCYAAYAAYSHSSGCWSRPPWWRATTTPTPSSTALPPPNWRCPRSAKKPCRWCWPAA